jgi:hypothetical protein
MLTGVVHSRVLNVEGMMEKSVRARITWITLVSVVLWARHVSTKRVEVS